jgi:hypothetical protein
MQRQGIFRFFAFQPRSEVVEALTDPDEPSLGLLVTDLYEAATLWTHDPAGRIIASSSQRGDP